VLQVSVVQNSVCTMVSRNLTECIYLYIKRVVSNLLCLHAFQVGVEIPMDSDDADEENKLGTGKTLLHIFQRG
jgi:hypothetical protein